MRFNDPKTGLAMAFWFALCIFMLIIIKHSNKEKYQQQRMEEDSGLIGTR